MYIRSSLVLLLAIVGVLEGGVQSDPGLMFVETSRHADGESFTSTVRLLGDRIRFESSSPGQEQVFIYRADRQAMYLIDPAKRTYQEITREQLDQLAAKLEEMTAMIEEQMRSVPPSQRAMVEQMMRGMMNNMPGGVSVPIVYTRVSTGERVGEWACDRYEGHRGDDKVQEVCTADWRSLNLSADDFRVLQELGEFFEGLSSQFNFDLYQVGIDTEGSEAGTFPGMPVSRTTFANGQATMSHEISEFSRETFASSMFEVPEGFAAGPSPLEGLGE